MACECGDFGIFIDHVFDPTDLIVNVPQIHRVTTESSEFLRTVLEEQVLYRQFVQTITIQELDGFQDGLCVISVTLVKKNFPLTEGG